jgi:alanine dehydrogenase
VGNVPAAVPHTSTYALTNATLPYIAAVAGHGALAAAGRDSALRAGVNTAGGQVTNPAVAAALGLAAVEPLTALAG